MNSQLWWFVARASGIVAWVLITASVLWGLSVSIRLTRSPKPAWMLDLHRFLGGLAVAFTGVHLAGLVADSYVHFGPSELLIPFASAWKPGPVAWGIVAMYLLLAVELSSLAMRRLPRKLWHAVHFSSYLIFALVTIHMFAAGSEAGDPALQWTALVSVAAVGFLTIVRILAPRRAAAQSVDAQSIEAQSTEQSSAPTRPTRAAQLAALRQQLDDARTNTDSQARVPVGATSRSPGAPDQPGPDTIDWTP